MSIPYWAVGNEELKDLPPVKAGDEIFCDKCNGRHILHATKNAKTGAPFHMILTYSCGAEAYIGAINGKLVAHARVGNGGQI